MAQTAASVGYDQQVCLQTQQQLLLQAFTLPPPLATGIIHWGTHIFILGFRHSARQGGGTVPGTMAGGCTLLLSRQTTSMTVKQRMGSFHLLGRHPFLFGL